VSDETPAAPADDTGRPGSADDLIAVRRGKLARLRADGIDPFPHAFPGVKPIGEVRAAHADLEAGEETDSRYRIAGRLHARRGQGKMAFLDLDDRSGRLQLQARRDVLGEEVMDRLLELDLGDLVGIDGTIFCSRRGELSLRVEEVTVLAKSLRPPPDKHHGLQDVEQRFRRRELDLIGNEEARRLFTTRAKVISTVRRELDDVGFIEVETPILQPLYGGAMARPFTTHHNALARDFYLRIATELYLKRLIVGGLERVYELGKDFRNEGVSFKHNPEFTMLEWYEAYADYEDAATRLESMVHAVAVAVDYAGELEFTPPWRRVSFVEAIQEATGVDIMAHPEGAELAAAVRAAGHELKGMDELTWPQLVDDLLSKFVEPHLTQPTIVMDYPVAISPFAKAHRSKPGLTERFEAFAGGMEIANAFTELNDPDVQRERFEAQARFSEAGDEEAQPYDELFVQALEQGMPPTGGLGLGIDRLVMLMTGTRSIREVVLFPAMRD
jgi:lysyl-tRNA synthetase class 2